MSEENNVALVASDIIITDNGGTKSRGDEDEFMEIDPIEILPGERTRWQGVDKEKVDDICKSYESVGQLEPIVCGRNKEGKLTVVFGEHRYAAAVLYNNKHSDNPMQVKVIVKASWVPGDFLLASIAENVKRKTVSMMDNAYAQDRLRRELGWSQQAIAEYYGCSKSLVSRYSKLLRLKEPIQQLVHHGVLGLDHACIVADKDEAGQQAYIEELKAKNQLLSLKQLSGEETITRERGSRSAPEGGYKLTAAEIKKDLPDAIKNPKNSEQVCRILEKILGAFVGNKKPSWLVGELKKMFPND